MEHTRKMYFNELSFGRPQDQEDNKVLFGSNCVKTNRYGLEDFLTCRWLRYLESLLERFGKLANIEFLIIGFLDSAS